MNVQKGNINQKVKPHALTFPNAKKENNILVKDIRNVGII